MISTTIDYYNPDTFSGRTTQIENGYFAVSLGISAFFFLATLIYLIYVPLKRLIIDKEIKNRAHLNEELMSWMSMAELEWYHPKLVKKMTNIITQKQS